MEERMSRIDFTQPHLDIAVVECGDETENFTPIGDLSTILFELGIVCLLYTSDAADE